MYQFVKIDIKQVYQNKFEQKHKAFHTYKFVKLAVIRVSGIRYYASQIQKLPVVSDTLIAELV